MVVNTAKGDSISQELSADYWREKSECLEEWVCELLTKNQALRMELQQEESQFRHRLENPLVFSLQSVFRSHICSTRPAFRTDSPTLTDDMGVASCPRKECAEVRKSVVRNAALNGSVPGANGG